MELLQACVECLVIVLWLGRESIATNQTDLHANLAPKEATSARLKGYEGGKRAHFQPIDRRLAFCEVL